LCKGRKIKANKLGKTEKKYTQQFIIKFFKNFAILNGATVKSYFEPYIPL